MVSLLNFNIKKKRKAHLHLGPNLILRIMPNQAQIQMLGLEIIWAAGNLTPTISHNHMVAIKTKILKLKDREEDKEVDIIRIYLLLDFRIL